MYYLLRSQPPMLIPMVYDYYIATGNMDFVQEMLPSLEKEYHFWVTQRFCPCLSLACLTPNQIALAGPQGTR